MIDGQNFFSSASKNDLRIYDNIRKFMISQGNDDATGYLLDYPYFEEIFKLKG